MSCALVAALGLLQLAGCTGVLEKNGADSPTTSEIVNGKPVDYPAVVQVHPSIGRGSGTLIGTRTVLTAAHCTLDDWANLWILVEATGQVVQVADGARHPDFVHEEPGDYNDDVAILRLADDVRDVAPLPLLQSPPLEGEELAVLGWGSTADQAGDYGTLRLAHNTVGEIGRGYFRFDGATGDNGTVCNGDSGGPSLIRRGDTEYVAGIHSKSWCKRIQFNRDTSFALDTRVDAHFARIATEANGNLFDGHTYEKEAPTGRLEVPSELRAGQPFDLRIHVSDDVRLRSVTVLVDDATAIDEPSSGKSATHSTSLALPEGTHRVSLRVRDGADRETKIEETLVVGSPGTER